MSSSSNDMFHNRDNKLQVRDSQPEIGTLDFAARYRFRRDELGLKDADISRLSGIPTSNLSRYGKGPDVPKSEHLFPLSDALRVSARWLISGTDRKSDLENDDDTVMVQEIDLAYGMGATYIEAPIEAKAIPFPRPWLRTFTKADPQHLFFARGDGDSMMPTILDQDIVLIDRSDASINRQDRIWAIAYGEIGMIKRVRAMPDGSYKLMSDNPAVEPETAVDGEMHVIGRVVAVIRKT